MKNEEYRKFGIYFNKWSISYQQFGFGIVWEKYEKYIHFNLFNFELAIGKTGN